MDGKFLKTMSRRIVIVGNGEIPQGVADWIDTADVIIRFNDCRSLGAGGSRTDVVAVCNTGRPGRRMIEDRSWRESPGVKAASAIWSVRDPVKFSEMEEDIHRHWPELEDFCVDYSAEFAAIASETGKTHLVISRQVHEWLDEELKGLSPEPYVCPSTGLFAIRYMLDAIGEKDELTIAGFCHKGWSGHPFSVEKQLVDALVTQGKLKQLSSLSNFSVSEGA
ncbi:hypothetical protein QE369_003266 [Agrobacterium larrymoorei]|uniref:Urease operon accessory protein n=2 Tax=Agrobacterium larrymoorei TaxID=160699 RepID=A0AAJ2BHX2_9HYPH|nr:hypothetical protein [Agrobacterium larrymoorei]